MSASAKRECETKTGSTLLAPGFKFGFYFKYLALSFLSCVELKLILSWASNCRTCKPWYNIKFMGMNVVKLHDFSHKSPSDLSSFQKVLFGWKTAHYCIKSADSSATEKMPPYQGRKAFSYVLSEVEKIPEEVEYLLLTLGRLNRKKKGATRSVRNFLSYCGELDFVCRLTGLDRWLVFGGMFGRSPVGWR